MKMYKDKFFYMSNLIHRTEIDFGSDGQNTKEFSYDSDGDAFTLFFSLSGKITVDYETKWR